MGFSKDILVRSCGRQTKKTHYFLIAYAPSVNLEHTEFPFMSAFFNNDKMKKK